MGLQTYLAKSGLVVAEDAPDETGLQRALEQLDPRLVLTREVSRRHGCYVWHVHVNWATDRPAMHVLRWEDEYGVPLPLSSGLLERVRERLAGDPDSAAVADRMNDAHVARVERDLQEAYEEAARVASRLSAPGHSAVLHRSQALRRSRSKAARR